jgi:flagellar biosynthesis protein FlhF
MHLKRFRAATVTEAFDAARRELGPDVLILGTGMVRVRGMRGLMGAREVEVTAAVERQVSEVRRNARTDRHSAPLPDAHIARLTALGLDASVIGEITGSWSGRSVSRGLGRRRGFPHDEMRKQLMAWSEKIAAHHEGPARVEVFIGPAGAGKTTTVAKIAAQARVKSGRRFGLVSADAFRLGAIEQLRLYAEIIGAPFVAARTPEEVVDAVTGGTTPLLVDTAGRSPRDDRANALMSLMAVMPGVRVHLVVPAATSARQLGRLLDDHAPAAPQRVVLTKLDEADTIGPLAGVLRERGLRVSYIADGQRVPEDLHRATPATLAAALVGDAIDEAGHAA